MKQGTWSAKELGGELVSALAGEVSMILGALPAI